MSSQPEPEPEPEPLDMLRRMLVDAGTAAEEDHDTQGELTDDGAFRLRPRDFGSAADVFGGGRPAEPPHSPVQLAEAGEAGDEPLLVGDSYLWSARSFDLPVRIRFTFTFLTPGELLPCFSANCEQFGGANPDALSWYIATHRDDFTFRTGMFNGFPHCRRGEPLRCEIGKQYNMECCIHPAGTGYPTGMKASYYIDGEFYAQVGLRERSFLSTFQT